MAAERADAFGPPGARAGSIVDDGIDPGLNAIDRMCAGAGMTRSARRQQDDDDDGMKSGGACHWALPPLRMCRNAGQSAARRSSGRAPQLVERDREIAHTLSGRVVDRIGNGCRDADDADLAEPLDAE